MARKNNSPASKLSNQNKVEKNRTDKKATAVELESKEELLSRVKRELIKTFITAAIAMAIGIALEKIFKF